MKTIFDELPEGLNEKLKHLASMRNSTQYLANNNNRLLEQFKQAEKIFISDEILPWLEAYLNPLLKYLEIQIPFPKLQQNQLLRTNRTIKSVPRSKYTILRVLLPNQKIIQENNAAQTYAKTIALAIEEKGIDVVMQVIKNKDIMRDGDYILKKGLFTNPKANPQYIGNGYYVNSHISNLHKKQVLDRLLEGLHLPWHVQIEECPY